MLLFPSISMEELFSNVINNEILINSYHAEERYIMNFALSHSTGIVSSLKINKISVYFIVFVLNCYSCTSNAISASSCLQKFMSGSHL